MSGKPSVTLTMAGDEKKLTESFDRVGAASKQMADKVDSSSKDIQRGGDRLDTLTDSADKAEQRSMGFKDTLDGLTGGMAVLGDSSLSTTEKLMGLGQAGADFAGGIANFVLPMLGNFATFLKGPLATAMTFVSSHPLLIVVGLLILAFVTLWMTSETFRDVVIKVFKAVGTFIADVFGRVINWLVGAWNGLVEFFTGLPGRIGSALSSLATGIGNAFKGALNLVIDYLNWWVDRVNNIIGGINDVNPFSDIPPVPHIQRLHTGGVFHSATGEGLALLKDGERVSAPGQGSGGTWRVSGSGALFDVINAGIRNGDIVVDGR